MPIVSSAIVRGIMYARTHYCRYTLAKYILASEVVRQEGGRGDSCTREKKLQFTEIVRNFHCTFVRLRLLYYCRLAPTPVMKDNLLQFGNDVQRNTVINYAQKSSSIATHRRQLIMNVCCTESCITAQYNLDFNLQSGARGLHGIMHAAMY